MSKIPAVDWCDTGVYFKRFASEITRNSGCELCMPRIYWFVAAAQFPRLIEETRPDHVRGGRIRFPWLDRQQGEIAQPRIEHPVG